jgi:hypothetical protein
MSNAAVRSAPARSGIWIERNVGLRATLGGEHYRTWGDQNTDLERPTASDLERPHTGLRASAYRTRGDSISDLERPSIVHETRHRQ